MIPAENRVYCPAPKCSALLEAEEGNSPGPTECPECHILMCSRCAPSAPTASPHVQNTALCCTCCSGTAGEIQWQAPTSTQPLLSCPAGANSSGTTAATARRPRPGPRTRSSLTWWNKTSGDSARSAGTRQGPFSSSGNSCWHTRAQDCMLAQAWHREEQGLQSHHLPLQGEPLTCATARLSWHEPWQLLRRRVCVQSEWCYKCGKAWQNGGPACRCG